MKISIKTEPYYSTPAPSLTKEIMRFFYNRLWSFRFSEHVKTLETLEVRVNQALPYSPLHFYVTLNGKHKFHVDSEDLRYFGKYHLCNEPRYAKKWDWLHDFNNAAPKHLRKRYKKRYNKEWEVIEQERLASQKVSREAAEYRKYLHLKSKYENTQ